MAGPGSTALISRPDWDLSRQPCRFGNHFLDVLRAWVGPLNVTFGFLLGNSLFKLSETDSSRQWENVQRANLQHMIRTQGPCWPQSLACHKSSLTKDPCILRDGRGQTIKWKTSKLALGDCREGRGLLSFLWRSVPSHLNALFSQCIEALLLGQLNRESE